MDEIWRDIEGYEGIYQISNKGRVKSLYKGSERILKPWNNGRGYYCIILCNDNVKKTFLLHRLVAQAFIPNLYNLSEVNHKDENKLNNCVVNLEWCTRQYNVDYSLSKAVIGIDKVSGLILEFPSTREAERQTGISKGNICDCLKGKLKTAGGFVWRYKEED